MEVALYARVSTPRQFENAISVPDQLAQMRAWAAKNGHVVVKEYIEPGDSATDDKRVVFQDMITDATLKGAAPFQLIAIHSFSRFFRNHIEGAIYQRKLLKHGVKVESITQHTSDDPSGEMHRSMIMLFDEYQSKEIAKHTLRGMQENARQGYFNGSKAPFGYKTVATGQTGIRGRIKKKLEIHEPEAEIVREIFSLYVNGKEGSPRLGMKEIAKHLNGRGVKLRGKPFRIQVIHLILSSLTYSGWHVFNKLDSKTRKIKPEAEWVKNPVPAIVTQELFDKATALRQAHTPKMRNPSRDVSPNLLTGILKCDCCGGAMVQITAKNSRYRYYKCANRLSKGNTVCQSANHPMEVLDSLVLDAFRHKIYTPEYIRALIDEMRKHASNNGGEEKLHIKRLESELKEIEQAEINLFEGVEKGVLDLNDRLRERVQQHKARRGTIVAELATLQSKNQSPLQILTPQKIEAVARVMKKRFSTSTPFSRDYLKATLSEIRVDDKLLKLYGQKKTLANLVASNGVVEVNNPVHRSAPQGTPIY